MPARGGPRRRTGGTQIDADDGPLDPETRGVARYTWSSLIVGHLFVTVWAASELVRAWSGSVTDLALATGLALAFGVHVRCSRVEIHDDAADAVGWIVGGVVLGYLLVAASPADPAFEHWTMLPMPAVALAALRLERPYRGTAVVAAPAVSLLIRYLGAGPEDAFTSAERAAVWFLFGTVLGTSYLFQLWFWGVTVRMDQARRTVGALAAARERAQVASDLHDIQGHHLQVIALEAELAGKLVDVDGARTRDLLDQISARARRAMDETRALVDDSRRVSFVPQLVNAVDVLGAGGIAVEVTSSDGPSERLITREDVGPDLTRHTDGLADEVLEALGFVVREATTNLLRHSQADTVRVRLDLTAERVVLTVQDDAPSVGAVTSRPPSAGGHGLEGLRDRVQRLGGSLSAEATTRGFTLSATLPTHVVSAAAATTRRAGTSTGGVA